MNKLYTNLAEVYEAMYATFINYKAEYEYYCKILNQYEKKSVLEIGSGTGNLAADFQENGFAYSGLDLSGDMIKIAKRKTPGCNFMQGDMRNFVLEKPVESVIITGRTISYLLTNKDVMDTFKQIHKNLETGGILCFDFIDANRFIPEVAKGETIVHEAVCNNINYVREGKWKLILAHGMDFIWTSKYSKQVGDEFVEIGTDTSTVRTFTQNEIEIFLVLNGFSVKKLSDRKSYAFPTYVVVAEKY